MKRILIFSTSYFPHIGGAEVAIKEITDRLPKYEFEMITTRLKKEWLKQEKVGNIMVHRLGRGSDNCKFMLPFLGPRKAKALVREKKFDMIWCMLASHASIAAARFQKETKLPLLLTLQEGDNEKYLTRYVGGSEFLYKLLIRPLHLMVFKRASYIQAISEHLKKRAERNAVVCPIKVVPNGVDIEKFSHAPCHAAKVKKDPEEILLLTVSRLVKKNGITDIISALPLLKKNIKLLIIGDGPERKNLLLQSKKLKVNNRVKFIGAVSTDKTSAYYWQADIFIRPSLSEGQGISFLEAMAARVPVITTPVGGIVDFLFDPNANQDKEPTGIFCEPRNPKSIVKAINQYLDDPALRERIINNAEIMVKEKYQWDGIVKRMEEIFEHLTPSPSPSQGEGR